MSEKKKHKLSLRHDALLQDYKDKMSKYKLKHPDLKQGASKSRSGLKMTTPLAFYYAERSKQSGQSGRTCLIFLSVEKLFNFLYFLQT